MPPRILNQGGGAFPSSSPSPGGGAHAAHYGNPQLANCVGMTGKVRHLNRARVGGEERDIFVRKKGHIMNSNNDADIIRE